MLDLYRPQPDWFAHNPYGIHGIAHVARVLVWAEQLAEQLVESGADVDREAVRWAAVLHDVGRWDDGRDREHGERSAAWVLANASLLPAKLEEQTLAKVVYCCRWHVPADSLAPEMTNELQCLKDADGLDRVRIFDLDPKHLRLPGARLLVQSSWDLFEATYPPSRDDPFCQVREAARARGLWR